MCGYVVSDYLGTVANVAHVDELTLWELVVYGCVELATEEVKVVLGCGVHVVDYHKA